MNSRDIQHEKKSEQTGITDETVWIEEQKQLKKLSRLVFYDIQRLESIFCLEVYNSINFFAEVRKFEVNLIETALLWAGGNQRRSAKLLGISSANLNNKIKSFGINPKKLRGKPM